LRIRHILIYEYRKRTFFVLPKFYRQVLTFSTATLACLVTLTFAISIAISELEERQRR